MRTISCWTTCSSLSGSPGVCSYTSGSFTSSARRSRRYRAQHGWPADREAICREARACTDPARLGHAPVVGPRARRLQLPAATSLRVTRAACAGAGAQAPRRERQRHELQPDRALLAALARPRRAAHNARPPACRARSAADRNTVAVGVGQPSSVGMPSPSSSRPDGRACCRRVGNLAPSLRSSRVGHRRRRLRRDGQLAVVIGVARLPVVQFAPVRIPSSSSWRPDGRSAVVVGVDTLIVRALVARAGCIVSPSDSRACRPCRCRHS
jgi:hypothetical protein